MMFKEHLRQHFKIVLTKKQEEQFESYFNKLVEYNKHTNLTTITERKEVYYKHFYDSLTLLPFIKNENASLCDMGSGAGFPSIPLKIIYPSLKITIIDSANKRVTFLKQLVELLKLEDVTISHSRVEEYGLKNQEKFDIVTARALGNFTLISEMALPMLKVGGTFLVMKGSRGKEELNEAQNALKILSGKVVNEMNLELPYDYGMRSIFKVEKTKHVKGYPRRYPEMLKKPL